MSQKYSFIEVVVEEVVEVEWFLKRGLKNRVSCKGDNMQGICITIRVLGGGR